MSTAPQSPPSAPVTLDTPLMDRINLYFRVRRYLKMLGRRWFILVLALAAGVGIAAYHAYQQPPIYRAVSKIGIAPRVITPYDSKAAMVVDLNSFYETHLQYMLSTKVRARVQEKLRGDERLAGIGSPVSANASRGLGFFLMTVDSTNLLHAQQYATLWAREFMNFKEELTASTFDQSLAETRREIERYEKKLEKARETLQAFQISNNIASVKETADAAQLRLDKLLDEYSAVQTLRQRLENKSSKELLKGGMVETTRRVPDRTSQDGTGPNAPAMDPLERVLGESKYADLEYKLISKEDTKRRFEATIKAKHPFMVALQGEIDQLKREMQYQVDLIEDKRLARIESMKRDEESYKPLIENFKKQVFESRGIQNQHERLKGEENDVKADLENLRKQARALEASNNRENLLAVLEEGIGSSKPISPNRQKIILMGLFLGLMAGIGVIYLLDRLDDRLELAEDIESELEHPVIGQIPLLRGRQFKGRKLLITEMEEHSLFAESVRVVRSAVMLGIQEGHKQVMVITSAVPGDGKTTFSANFAVTLAIAGHRVLLVDADMRRGSISSLMEMERHEGLADILRGEINWIDVRQSTKLPNLQVIACGDYPANPGELLLSPIVQELIAEARKQYDYIVFDCPPLTAIDDTFALVNFADGILFVIRAGQTSMRFARNALAAVHQRGARVFGIVLNGITADNPYYYYNHYYHSYYQSRQVSEKIKPDDAPGQHMAAPRNRTESAAARTQSPPAHG